MRKLEINRKLGRPRPRWVDIIRMDLQEIKWDWTDLAQNTVREGLF